MGIPSLHPSYAPSLKQAGTPGAGDDRRRYDRHWTPLHIDDVVDGVDAAVELSRPKSGFLASSTRTGISGRSSEGWQDTSVGH
jgi:hypothetical protein